MNFRRPPQKPPNPVSPSLEQLIVFLFLKLSLQIQHVKEVLMSELDDATNRIVADIANAVSAIGDLRAAIEAAGNAGADTAALNAAADALEAALTPPA
jgi:hypothetical protein